MALNPVAPGQAGAEIVAATVGENVALRRRHRNLAVVLGLVAAAVSVGVLYMQQGKQTTKYVNDGPKCTGLSDATAQDCCACPESGEDKVLRVVFVSLMIGIATGGIMYVISEAVGVHHAAKDSRAAGRRLHQAAIDQQMAQMGRQ